MPNRRVLNQKRPSSTDFEEGYNVTTVNERAHIDRVNVSNNTDADVDWYLLLVLAGSAVDEGSAWAWKVKRPANSHRMFAVDMPLVNVGDRIMIKVSVADALTFTFLGEESS